MTYDTMTTLKKIVSLWILRACLIVTDVTLSDTQCSSLHCVTNFCDDTMLCSLYCDTTCVMFWHNTVYWSLHSDTICVMFVATHLVFYNLVFYNATNVMYTVQCALCSTLLRKNQFVQKLISEETFLSAQWGSAILQIQLNQDFCLIHPVWIGRLLMLARNICESWQILFASL